MKLHVKIKLTDGSDVYTECEDMAGYRYLCKRIFEEHDFIEFPFRTPDCFATVNPYEVVAIKCQPAREQDNE